MTQAACTVVRILQKYPIIEPLVERPVRKWTGWSSRTAEGVAMESRERQKTTLVLSIEEGCILSFRKDEDDDGANL
jgi:hypothetical protein